MTCEIEAYETEFKKQLEIFGLSDKDIKLCFTYIRNVNGRRTLEAANPIGKKEIWIDKTYGEPELKKFKQYVRHELFHKKRELCNKRRFYDEFLAGLAEYFDFIAKL
ncbi:MAG: hypothetical protein KKB25_03370 [Nanoarchaeota archaeon]|nr:hypothetical protein [bacterium]MBU3958091.1 hypothetical protein [Nanoarchaeota archaeon]